VTLIWLDSPLHTTPALVELPIPDRADRRPRARGTGCDPGCGV